MMTIGEFLKQLGLTDKQTVIYLDLAAYPQSSVVEISRRSHIPRSTIYLELERLEHTGLTTSSRVGKTERFAIINPQSLKNRLRDESNKITNLLNNTDTFTEELSKLQGVKTSINTVTVYKGQAGIKQLIWNTLDCKSGITYGFSPGALEDVTDRAFAEKWRNEFKLRKLQNKIILSKAAPLNWSDVSGFLENHVEARTLEKQKIKFDHEIFFFDDTTVIVSLKDDPNQYGIEIKDKLLTDSYKKLFELIWNEIAYWPIKGSAKKKKYQQH